MSRTSCNWCCSYLIKLVLRLQCLYVSRLVRLQLLSSTFPHAGIRSHRFSGIQSPSSSAGNCYVSLPLRMVVFEASLLTTNFGGPNLPCLRLTSASPFVPSYAGICTLRARHRFLGSNLPHPLQASPTSPCRFACWYVEPSYSLQVFRVPIIRVYGRLLLVLVFPHSRSYFDFATN